jgi:hypothetical protein
MEEACSPMTLREVDEGRFSGERGDVKEVDWVRDRHITRDVSGVLLLFLDMMMICGCTQMILIMNDVVKCSCTKNDCSCSLVQ